MYGFAGINGQTGGFEQPHHGDGSLALKRHRSWSTLSTTDLAPPTVAIVYEHSEAALRLVLEFDRRFVAMGWKVTTDYRNQEPIKQVGWILPMLGQLRAADFIVRVHTDVGYQGYRDHTGHPGLGEELAYLASSGKPLNSTTVESWTDLTPEDFDYQFDQMVENLVYLQGGHDAVQRWRDGGLTFSGNDPATD